MSDQHGALDDATRRGTQNAERGFRSRWTRVVLVEMLLGVVLVVAALLLRNTLHPSPVHAVGVSTTAQPSASAAPTSSSVRTSPSPTRSRTTSKPPTSRTTPPITRSVGQKPPVKAAMPSASEVKPAAGPEGTLVDIGGMNLDSVVAVSFGKIDTSVLPGGSAQVIQVMAPKGNAPGTKVAITLETKNGPVATTFVFAYDPLPPSTPS